MKLANKDGQAIYYNQVEKNGKAAFIVKALSGQSIEGRDREKRKSRTFTQESQAEAWLKRHGYNTAI